MPYWRLSAFYFFYFSALGGLIPYLGLYLKSIGFSAMEIGQLMTIMMTTKIIAPYFWAWLGDYFGRIIVILRLGSFLTCVFFSGLFFVTDFNSLALLIAFFSFFWNAVLPQFEVITLRYIHDQTRIYAKIRLWGSVGFIMAVLYLGFSVDAIGIPSILPVLMCLYLGIWLTSQCIQEPPFEKQRFKTTKIITILKKPSVIALLSVCFLMQMAHGAYYTFYSILLADLGYSKTMIGFLWSLGVVAEIMIFIFMTSLMARYNTTILLILSLFIGVLRWLLIGLGYDHFILLFIAQLMHAATFAIFHTTAIYLIHDYFIGHHQGRGQALYSSLSFGAGGAVGSFLSGYYWDSLGASIVFISSAFISFLALLIAWKFMINRTHKS